MKYYRGESKEYEYSCTPTLFRLPNYITLHSEKELYYSYFQEIYEISAFKVLPGDFREKHFYNLRFLIALQHYGFSTRLLDVTKDKYIALYFASKSHFRDDGYIYEFDSHSIKEISSANADSVKRKIECIFNIDNLKGENITQYFANKGQHKIQNTTIVDNIIVDYEKVVGKSIELLRYERQCSAMIMFGIILDDDNRITDSHHPINPTDSKKIYYKEKMDILFDLAINNPEHINSVYVYPDSTESLNLISKYNSFLTIKENNADTYKNEFSKYVKEKFSFSSKEITTDRAKLENEVSFNELINFMVENRDAIMKHNYNFYFVFHELIDFIEETGNIEKTTKIMEKIVEENRNEKKN